MKSITINYDVVLIILSSLIILIAARDIIVRKDEKWYKRISLAGWVLIIVAGASGYITWQKIKSDNTEKKLKEADAKKVHSADKKELQNDVEEAFKKHQASFNPVTKTIIHYIKTSDTLTIRDTTKRVPDPIMDVLVEDKNPILKGSLDSLKVRIEFAVINNGIAFNIRDKLTVFKVSYGNFSFLGATRRAVLESTKGYKESKIWIESPTLDVNKTRSVIDTTYFYFKALYSNKPEKGIDQPVLGKIYFVVSQPLIKSRKDIGEITEIQNEDFFIYLKNKLIENGYW